MMKLGRSTIAIVALLLGFFFVSNRVQAQTQTTGNIAGTVTDQTGAVVPGAMVSLKNSNQGTTHDTSTNATGEYHFYLLAPGPYVVTVTATGFQTVERPTEVGLGAVATADIQLTLGAQSQTVTVTEQAPLLKTENGDAETTLSEQQVQQIPNGGNDISYTATLAPGVVSNTAGGGLGNFSSFGLGADANLFTINGMDDNDPFLNLNNTGATDLMLGNNEVLEMSVVQNGYSATYGGLAGAQINVVTKGGTNDFHGRASYYWNGRTMNANSYFNNAADVPRSFVNANQWGADIGGPLIKNKVFWYFNTEGLYLVIPTSTQAFIPTADVATATQNNINTMFGAASPQATFYKEMFALYAGAPGYSGATPLPFNPDPTSPDVSQGCDSSASTTAVNNFISLANGGPGATGPSSTLSAQGFGPQLSGGVLVAGKPCTLLLQSNGGNLTHEWLVAGRVDWNLGNNDRMYARIEKESGVQASITDAINSAFNFVSIQPEYQGQYQWSHIFGSTMVNQFNAAGQWYGAAFNTSPTALSTFPTTLTFGDFIYFNSNTGTSLGGIDFDVPQGRNVTQYQLSDDLSKTIGNHSLKVGVKFHRADVSNLDNGINTSGTLTPFTLDAFYMGGSDPATQTGVGPTATNPNISTFSQAFSQVSEFPVATYSLAGYVEDDWKIKPNLTLNFGFRLEHQSNPICGNNCFAAPVVQFTSLDHNPTIPYNQAIQTGRRQALYSLTAVNPEPRFGFSWAPGRLKNTVIRGGAGIFYDAFPAVVVDNFAQNPPLYNLFTVGTAANPGQITPGVPGSLFGAAAASNAAFTAGFGSGATLANLQAAVPGFTPPALASVQNHTKTAQVQKWSLEVQHGFGANMTLTVGYVGNHAQNLSYFNNGLNAYDPSGNFVGLPTAPIDPRFGTVTQINTNATSNYNGGFLSFQKRWGASQVQVNYTYSHALDYISNSGDPNVGFSNAGFGASNTSVAYPTDPFHPFQNNYGPADYDVRHYLSANYIWQVPVRRALMGHGWSRLVDGWQVSGTVFLRSGLPFTPTDGSSSAALESFNYGSPTAASTIFATRIPGVPAHVNCGVPSEDICLNPSAFTQNVDSSGNPLGFGNVSRNSLRGPNYFNSDLSIMKFTNVPKWERAKVGIGFQFYNVFNHPNFQAPLGDVSSPQFGQVTSTASPATSIFGSGLGADSSPRLIQVKAQFEF